MNYFETYQYDFSLQLYDPQTFTFQHLMAFAFKSNAEILTLILNEQAMFSLSIDDMLFYRYEND